MSEQLSIFVTIQIENLGDQLVRGRPLGPWRLQSIGSSWKEVRKSLKRQLQKALPTTLPSDLFEGSLPPKFEQWETVVHLAPPARSLEWETPILVRLQSFRWHFRDGQCIVRVPAVNCTLFGKLEDLTPDEVASQARMALMRMAENKHLLSLRERFSDRKFDFAAIRIAAPVPGADVQQRSQDRRQQSKKTATLRSTATELTAIQREPVYGLDERVREIAEYLRGETPQSVLIVGPAGEVRLRWSIVCPACDVRWGCRIEESGLPLGRGSCRVCLAWGCGNNVAQSSSARA